MQLLCCLCQTVALDNEDSTIKVCSNAGYLGVWRTDTDEWLNGQVLFRQKSPCSFGKMQVSGCHGRVIKQWSVTIHLLRHTLSSIIAKGRTGKTSLFIEILGQELLEASLLLVIPKKKCYTSVHVMPRCSEKQEMPTKVKKYLKPHFDPHTEAFFTICSLNNFPPWSTSVFSPRPFPITWDFVHLLASVWSCACAQIHSCFSMPQETVVFVVTNWNTPQVSTCAQRGFSSSQPYRKECAQ